MKSFLKAPLYLIEVFTSSKSFSGNPIIGSAFLNRCGLHVARMLLGHFIMHLRMLMLSIGISTEDRRHYFKYGYLTKENYLATDEFNKLEEEVRDFDEETREARQGDTLTHRAVLSPDVLSRYPILQSILFSKSFQRLTRFTSGHLRNPLFYRCLLYTSPSPRDRG